MGSDSHLLHIRHNSTKLGVPLHLPFIHWVVGVQEESVRHGQGGNGGGNSNKEGMDIGNENNRTLIGNSILSTNGCESSPLLQVKGRVGIGDKAVALGVGTGAHDHPAEHGVAAVPDFGLDGWTPAPLGEVGVFLTPVLYGIVEYGASDAGAGSDHNNNNERGQEIDRYRRQRVRCLGDVDASNASMQYNNAYTPSYSNTYLETLVTTELVDGANAETELAARKRAAKVRRGAMVDIDLKRILPWC